MSVLVFAAPGSDNPPPVASSNVEYTHFWTGVDGVTWNLNDWSAGVYLQAGVVGLGHTSYERYTVDSPALPGSLFGGARALARAVQLPVTIASQPASGSWRELVRRWWSGWSTRAAGTWRVSDSQGRSLYLDLRHNPAADFSLSIDPGLLPWTPWMVDAVADFPYWRGDPITRSWGSPQQYLFLGGGDPTDPAAVQAAPPFAISSASSLNEAMISNPGKVDAYLVWTITGPFDSLSLTVGGGTIGLPAISAGHTVVVDSSPTNPIALLDGATEMPLTAWDPRPVPAGNIAEITIAATGTGTVSVELTPLYEIGF